MERQTCVKDVADHREEYKAVRAKGAARIMEALHTMEDS